MCDGKTNGVEEYIRLNLVQDLQETGVYRYEPYYVIVGASEPFTIPEWLAQI